MIKAKNDIKALQKKIDQVNAAAAIRPPRRRKGQSGRAAGDSTASAADSSVRRRPLPRPPATSRSWKSDQGLSRAGFLEPRVDQQYKELTRDYETAQKTYNDLLTKKSQAETQNDMEREQQGEQMQVLAPADLPSSPSFPNRLMFAGGGLAGGLSLVWLWPCGSSSAISRSAPKRMCWRCWTCQY